MRQSWLHPLFYRYAKNTPEGRFVQECASALWFMESGTEPRSPCAHLRKIFS
ncbi:hypothetical protein AmDm5_0764 [Acetobacter malorum]|nr:hypothetical protein AmDm5_0764 [Acetobacter malorum]